ALPAPASPTLSGAAPPTFPCKRRRSVSPFPHQRAAGAARHSRTSETPSFGRDLARPSHASPAGSTARRFDTSETASQPRCRPASRCPRFWPEEAKIRRFRSGYTVARGRQFLRGPGLPAPVKPEILVRRAANRRLEPRRKSGREPPDRGVRRAAPVALDFLHDHVVAAVGPPERRAEEQR